MGRAPDEVDAHLAHRLEHGRVDGVDRGAAGAAYLHCRATQLLEQAGGHLRASGVVHADEQHLQGSGHAVSATWAGGWAVRTTASASARGAG